MTIGFADMAFHMGPDDPVRALYTSRSVLSGELYQGGRRCGVFSLIDGWSGPWDGVAVVVEGYGSPHPRGWEVSSSEVSVFRAVSLEIAEALVTRLVDHNHRQ